MLKMLTRTRTTVIRRATMVEKNIHRVEDVNEDEEEGYKKGSYGGK